VYSATDKKPYRNTAFQKIGKNLPAISGGPSIRIIEMIPLVVAFPAMKYIPGGRLSMYFVENFLGSAHRAFSAFQIFQVPSLHALLYFQGGI
jgi:hypothetical protein